MHAERGFTLIEALVTVAIVVITAAGMSALFNTSNLTKATQQQDIALRIANNKLQAIRAGGYSNIPANGTFTDSLLSSLPSGIASTSASAFNGGTKQITVTVSWWETNVGTSSVSLTTLLAQTGGL